MAAEASGKPVSGARTGGGGVGDGDAAGVGLGDDGPATGDDPVHALSTEPSTSKAINARREFDVSLVKARRC
jgi:hypothetical protein